MLHEKLFSDDVKKISSNQMVENEGINSKDWNKISDNWEIEHSPKKVQKDTGFNSKNKNSDTRIEKVLQEKATQRNQPSTSSTTITGYSSLFDEGGQHIKSSIKGGGSKVAVENLHFEGTEGKMLPFDSKLNGTSSPNKASPSSSPKRRQDNTIYQDQSVLLENGEKFKVVKSITGTHNNKNNEFTFNITVPEEIAVKANVITQKQGESFFESRINDNKAKTHAISTKEFDGTLNVNDKEHVMFQRTFKDYKDTVNVKNKDNNTFVLNEHHMPLNDVIDLKTKIREESILLDQTQRFRMENPGDYDREKSFLKQNDTTAGIQHEKFTLAEGVMPTSPLKEFREESKLREVLKNNKKDDIENSRINKGNAKAIEESYTKKANIFGDLSGFDFELEKHMKVVTKKEITTEKVTTMNVEQYEKRLQQRTTNINDISNISTSNNNNRESDFNNDVVNETQDLGGLAKLNFSKLDLDENWDKSILDDYDSNQPSTSFFDKK